jgi:hypothetical protein
MKKNQLLLVALMISVIATLTQAQTFYPALKKFTSADKERIDKSYAAALMSNHNGIIGTSLAIVTMVKLDMPSIEFSNVKEEIDNLAIKGTTPSIRYKAYLAGAVFTNPAMFKEVTDHRYSDADALFSAVADKMTKTLLSSR